MNQSESSSPNAASNGAKSAGRQSRSSALARASSEPPIEAVRSLRRWAEPGILLLVFVGALAWFGRSLHLTLDLRDEGYLFYEIERVASGEVPHRDFRSVYGPLVYAANAPVYRASGGEILAVRRQLSVLRAVAVVAVYAIARHLVGRPHALLAALLAAAYFGRVLWNLNTPYAALYTVPIALLALWLALHGLAREPRERARDRHGPARGPLAWLFAAGFASGTAVLFKQSLGLACAYGLGMALTASGLLSESSGGRARGRGWILVLWGLAAAAIAAPFAAGISALDYALHFLPLHALLLVIGVRFARRGDPAQALRTGLPRLAAFAAGLVLPLLATAALYASWGSLGLLADHMFALPMRLENYALPVDLPPPRAAALLGAGLAACAAGLFALRRAWAPATLLALLVLPLAIAARGALRSFELVLIAADGFNGVLLALTTAAGTVLVAARLLPRDAPPAGPRTLALISVLLMQASMAFQIFPRGGFNAVLVLGTLAPVMALLIERAAAAARQPGGARPRLRAGLAFALAALVPAFLVSHIVVQVLRAPAPASLEESDLRMPAVRGVRVPPPEFQRDQLRAVEWLVDHLKTQEPADAPLLLITNEPMLLVLSGRRSLAPDYLLELFLIGLDMWPAGPEDPDIERTLLQRLAAEPRAMLVERDDASSLLLRRRFPELDRTLSTQFGVEYRVGPYRVLRRKALRA
jgi:hypothetical protein